MEGPIYSYFKKRYQKKSKKPISQDCKVIWEFFKLANNAGSPAPCSKDLRWRVIWMKEALGYELNEVAAFLRLSSRTVERYKRTVFPCIRTWNF